MQLKKLFDNKLNEKNTTLAGIFADSSIKAGVDRMIIKNAINKSNGPINDPTIIRHITELAHILAGSPFVLEVELVLGVTQHESSGESIVDIKPNSQNSLTINF